MKINLYKKLCMNYDKEPNEELFNLWNEMLEEYDPYYIELAVNNIIKNDKFFPTFSRLLEEYKNIPAVEIPQEEKEKRMRAKGVIPSWLNKEIINQPLDEETNNLFNDFNSFIQEFRNE